MILTLLLDATEAATIVAELMPLLHLIMILAPVIYAVTIYLLIGRKRVVWRVAGWTLAAGFFALGVHVAQQPNDWEVFNAFSFIPVVIGLFNEYRLRQILSV